MALETVEDVAVDGDMLITLRNPNPLFAVWNNNQDHLPITPVWPEPTLEFGLDDPCLLSLASNKSHSGQAHRIISSQAESDKAESLYPTHPTPPKIRTTPSELQYRVSSKHLISASSYFRAMLQGPWTEGITSDASQHNVDARDWNTQAFEILLDILHGNGQKIPKYVDLELFAHMAVLVDYYNCHNAVKFISDAWFEKLAKSYAVPEEYCRDSVLWLLIAHVFEKWTIIDVLKRRAVREAKGPFQSLNLPIPKDSIGMIPQH